MESRKGAVFGMPRWLVILFVTLVGFGLIALVVKKTFEVLG